MTTKIHGWATALAVCLLLAPSLALAYGGGGDVGGPPRSGGGATIGSGSAYSDRCVGVTDAESFHREFDRRERAVEASSPAEREALRNSLYADLTLSGLAWNENVDVPPRVRHLAMVLESMTAAGDITPEQAMGLVMIYARGTQLRQQREARDTFNADNRRAMIAAFGATAQTPAAQPPADQAPTPPAPTTTRAGYANAINNHQSAEAAYQAYVWVHGEPDAGAMPQNEEHASLLVSTLAWDETLAIPASVRRLAVIMESKIVDGTITPRNAYTLLMAQLAKTGARADR